MEKNKEKIEFIPLSKEGRAAMKDLFQKEGEIMVTSYQDPDQSDPDQSDPTTDQDQSPSAVENNEYTKGIKYNSKENAICLIKLRDEGFILSSSLLTAIENAKDATFTINDWLKDLLKTDRDYLRKYTKLEPEDILENLDDFCIGELKHCATIIYSMNKYGYWDVNNPKYTSDIPTNILIPLMRKLMQRIKNLFRNENKIEEVDSARRRHSGFVASGTEVAATAGLDNFEEEKEDLWNTFNSHNLTAEDALNILNCISIREVTTKQEKENKENNGK